MTTLNTDNAKLLRQIVGEEKDTGCKHTLSFYSCVSKIGEGRCCEIKSVCDNKEIITYITADDLIKKYKNEKEPPKTLMGKWQYAYNYTLTLSAIPVLLIIKIVVFLLLELLRYLLEKRNYEHIEFWYGDSIDTYSDLKYISYEEALKNK